MTARLGDRPGRSPRRWRDSSPRGRSGNRARGRSPPEPKGRAPVTSRLGDRRSPVRSRSKDRKRRRSPSADARSGGPDSRRPGCSPSPSRGGRDSRSQLERRDDGGGSPSSSKCRRDAASPDDAKRRRRDGASDAKQQQEEEAGRGGGGDERSASKASRGAEAEADADRPSARAAAAAAAAGAGGAAAAGGGSPARDIEAVARRFGGRLEGADSIFADIQLEKDVKAWLRELAAYLGEPPRPPDQPKALALRVLAKDLPLPRHVIRAYQGVKKLIQARPELSLAGVGWLQLLPEHHAELLAASRGAAPSASQQQLGSGAAAAGGDDGSSRDPEEAEGRGSGRGQGNKKAAGSGGRREQQQPSWQEDRQPYAGGSSRSGGAAAAAAAGSGGGEDRARDMYASPLPRRGEAAGGSGAGAFPGPPRTPHDKRPAEPGRGGWADRGYGGGASTPGRGGAKPGSGPGAPVLPANLADLVLREFGDKLSVALRSNPGGYVSQALAYDLLPLPLADRVRPGTNLTLAKLLQDHYPAFELRRERPDGPLVVMRHPNPGRVAGDRVCSYWDPVALGGCYKGDGCDFKHELVPGGGGRF